MRNELDWNPAVELVEKLTDGPIATGTRYRAKWKGGPPVEVTVVEFERPSTWRTHNDGPVEVTFHASLLPDAEGSRLTVEFNAQPHGWIRLVFPLLRRRLQRDEKANMTFIREALEAK